MVVFLLFSNNIEQVETGKKACIKAGDVLISS